MFLISYPKALESSNSGRNYSCAGPCWPSMNLRWPFCKSTPTFSAYHSFFIVIFITNQGSNKFLVNHYQPVTEVQANPIDTQDESVNQVRNLYLILIPDVLDKTEDDADREAQLLEMRLTLTEERNAVMVPSAGSGIPGAPAEWYECCHMPSDVPDTH